MKPLERIASWPELMAPVVDVQPAWNLVLIATGDPERFPPEVRAFARYKVEEAITTMREAADEVERRLRNEP